MMFIDVHCHLDFLEKEGVSVESAIFRAKESKIEKIVVNGVNLEHNKSVLDLSFRYKEVEASLGMYPTDCLNLSDKEINDCIKFIKDNKNKVVSIGEIGLDLKSEEAVKGFNKQKKVFEKFVKLALELNKPVIVHSRKAELEVIEILERLGAKKVDMHCFTGKFKLVDRIVKNGWFISIPTSVKNSEHFQKVIERVPIENLLCETDSPYLHPDKGWPNEPANVVESYKKIAEVKRISLKKVEKKIEENYKRLIGK